MTYLMMYLFTRLPKLELAFHHTFIGAIFFLICFLIVVSVYQSGNEEPDLPFKLLKIWWSKIAIVIIISGICWTATPNQKEMAAIWLIPTVVNNERLNTITGLSMDIVEEKAKSYLGQILEDGADFAKEKAAEKLQSALKGVEKEDV